MSFKDRFLKFWYFNFANPVVRKGEEGGWKWCFRRFWLEIGTVSGNFKARFTADEHPYAYLIAGEGDDNIIGFCQTMYVLGKTLTTDQGLVDDIQKAYTKYEKRLGKVKPEEDDEENALEDVKSTLEYSKLSKKEQKAIDRKFKKVEKEIKESDGSGE